MSDTIELIERYFDGSLNEQELQQFQQRLKEDAAFAEMFKIEQEVMEGIEAMGNQNLKTDLNSIYKEEILDKKPEAKKVNLNRRWFLIAAGIAVIFISVWVFNNMTGPLTAEKLYLQSFNPDFDFTERGGNDNLLVQAQSALQNKQYAIALPMLDELISQDHPQKLDFILAKGIALIEMGNFKDGLSNINQVGILSPEAYGNEVFWYKGLAVLKQNKRAESIDFLNKIPEESGRYNDAQALIIDIKKLMN